MLDKFSFIFLLLCSNVIFSQNNITANFPNTINTEEAFIIQKETKKPIVFFFYTDWCKYCFTMKKNTFTNNKVIDLLNENFHFVLFNVESKKPIQIKKKTFKNTSGVHQLAINLASKNGYMSYPSLVILNHKKRIDEQANTFLSAKQFEEFLTKYIENKKR